MYSILFKDNEIPQSDSRIGGFHRVCSLQGIGRFKVSKNFVNLELKIHDMTKLSVDCHLAYLESVDDGALIEPLIWRNMDCPPWAIVTWIVLHRHI